MSPFNPADVGTFGSKDREIDRTAEMVIDLTRGGRLDLAIWLIHDSNRTDAASLRFLAERVEYRLGRSKGSPPRVTDESKS
jgi:hypothetical protein